MGSLFQHIVERARPFLRYHLLLPMATLTAAAVAGGCESKSEVTTVPTQLKCQVTLAASSPSIGPDGGMGTVTITTAPECPWDVSTAANWLSGLSPTSGQGTSTVEFRVAPNPLPSSPGRRDRRQRQSRPGLATGGALPIRTPSKQLHHRRQRGNPRSRRVNGERAVHGPSRRTPTGSRWRCGTGSGTETVRVTIARNPFDERRIGTIILGDQRSTVTQTGEADAPEVPTVPGPTPAPAPACTYLVGPLNAEIAATGGTGTVVVSAGAGCAWTASSNAAWVSVTSGASGSGNGPVTFSVAANPGGARSGTLTIAGQAFTVTQAAAAAPPPPPVSCTYSISPTSSSIAAAGGTGTVAVSAGTGCAWTAGSSASWVAVTSGSSGSGDGPVTFSVAANPGDARSGTLTIAGQTFTVTQAAAPRLYLRPHPHPHPSPARLVHLFDQPNKRLHIRVGDRHRRRLHWQRLRVDGEQQRGLDHGDVGCERHWKRIRRVQRRGTPRQE